MVTSCLLLYVPGAGLNLGITVCVVLVYVAVDTLLARCPVASAMAFIVSVPLTVIAPVYVADAAVGTLPLMV
jgi:hypothetical protein